VKLAAIDLGTNTALLLIAEISDDGKINVLCDELRSPRMGKGVDAGRRISEESFQRVKEVFLEYKEIIPNYNVKKVIATGTSALRDASNREEFITQMQNETGIAIEILSGEEEALWTFRGGISGIENLHENVTVIDIGGGSTEISNCQYRNADWKEENLFSKSLDIGAVRLTEKFFSSLPPSESEIESARKFILHNLSEISPTQFLNSQLVGVAGTVTTLAALAQHLPQFDKEKISGYVLTIDTILNLFQNLSSKTSPKIRSLSETTAGREDILTAGTLILRTTMEYFGWNAVTASVSGLRFGIAISEWLSRQ